MNGAVHAFGENEAPAARLAERLGLCCRRVHVRRFPDGESLVRVERAEEIAILYRSLDHPNDKLIELLLAAAALRDGGARQVILVAPYLAYMRQDCAFNAGEAVSQQVIGALIAAHFDALVTVDPHLHRTPTLDTVIPGRPARVVSAAPALVEALRARAAGAVIIGPDVESRPWAQAIATPLGCPVIIGQKHRRGDREVDLRLPGLAEARASRAIIVDDLVSTGVTLRQCAAALRAEGIDDIDAVVVHCLAGTSDREALVDAGIGRLIATDSIPGPLATVALASRLAPAVEELLTHFRARPGGSKAEAVGRPVQ